MGGLCSYSMQQYITLEEYNTHSRGFERRLRAAEERINNISDELKSGANTLTEETVSCAMENLTMSIREQSHIQTRMKSAVQELKLEIREMGRRVDAIERGEPFVTRIEKIEQSMLFLDQIWKKQSEDVHAHISELLFYVERKMNEQRRGSRFSEFRDDRSMEDEPKTSLDPKESTSDATSEAKEEGASAGSADKTIKALETKVREEDRYVDEVLMASV
jgi:hypothetical protein